jgi:hypothetical protein
VFSKIFDGWPELPSCRATRVREALAFWGSPLREPKRHCRKDWMTQNYGKKYRSPDPFSNTQLLRLMKYVTVIITSSSPRDYSISLSLHRKVLADLCDLFRGMFTRPFRESGEETVTIEVAEGSSVEATVLFLEYLCYCNQQQTYTSVIVINSNKVFALADKLRPTGLRDSCEAYLSQHVCEDSVCSIWKISHILGLSETCGLGTK